MPIIGGVTGWVGELAIEGMPGTQSAIGIRNRTQNEAANTYANNSVNIQNTATGQQIGSHEQYGRDMTSAYDKKEGADKAAVNTQAAIASGGVNSGTGIIIGGITTKHGYDVRANQIEYNAGMKAMQISHDAGLESSIQRSQGALIGQFGSILANQVNQMFREVRF